MGCNFTGHCNTDAAKKVQCPSGPDVARGVQCNIWIDQKVDLCATVCESGNPTAAANVAKEVLGTPKQMPTEIISVRRTSG